MATLARHEAIFKPEMLKDTPIHIIGCGATGSNLALSLVKLGVPELHLYDMDVVEEHNIANQFFTDADIGKKKCVSLKENLGKFVTNPYSEVHAHDAEVTSENAEIHIENGIIFCVTDSMSSRNDLFKDFAKANIRIDYWIETRMNLDTVRVYAIDPCNCIECRKYEETLYTDENTVESACGTTQTAFPTASIVANQAVWMLLAHLNGKEHPNEFIQFYPTCEIMMREFKK